MNNNEFVLNLLALLDKQKSKTRINADIKELEKAIRKIRIVGTLAKGNTKSGLNQVIRQLEAQIRQIKIQAKIDSRQLNREINSALRNVSARDIRLNISSNGERVNAQVRRVISQAREFVNRNPISVNIDLKREKLLNQFATFTNKHTKINESSYWLGEAERLRGVIEAVSNRDELRDATDQFQVFTTGVRATGYAAVSTTDRIKGMLSNIVKVGNYFGLAFVAVNKFRESLNTLKTNDTILTEISKTSEMTKQQLKELGDEAFKVAGRYGQVSGNYLTAVQEMARSGYESLSNELGELSLLAQSAGDMTAEMANNYLLATDAAYKYGGSVEKLNAALDGANYVSNRNSASLTDIADATRVSASFAANAGVAIDELTAAEATMIATTKRSGSEIGRAFRSIILNLQGVSGEFDGEVIDEESLKKVEERCHSLGVELEYMKDGIATLRNPIEVLKDLAEVYNSLPDNSAEKQGLISDIGGKYHANALSALLSRWDLYEKMLSEYSQGAGSALEEANKTADSWEGRLNALQNSWDSFVSSLTNKEAVKGGISFLDNTIQTFEKLTDTLGAIPVLLTTINASMSAFNKNYGITKIYNKDAHKFDIQGNFMGINITEYKKQIRHYRDAEIAIRDWNSQLVDGIADINTFNGAVGESNAQLRAYLQTTSAEAPASLSGYRAYLNAAGVSTDALRLKTVLMTSAITMGASLLVSVGISALASFIDKIVVTKKEIEEAADEAKTTINDIKSGFDNLSSTTDDIKQRFAELAQSVENLGKANQSRGKLSTEDYEEFLVLSNQLAELFPQLIRGYDDNGNAILGLSGNVNTIVGSLNDLVLVQQKLANQQIIEKMPDVWKGYTAELEEYNKELKLSEEQVNAYQTALNKMSSGDGRTLTADSYFEQHAIINAARKTGLDDGKWYQNKLAEMSNEVYENGEFKYAEWDFSSLTDGQIEQLRNELGALGMEYEDAMQLTKDRIASANADMSAYINTWLSGEWNYSKMDSGMQNAVKDILLNTDWTGLLPDDVDVNNWDEVSNWLQQNFLYAINNIDDEKIKTAFADVVDGDFTVESIQEIIRQLLTTHGFDANNPLVIYLQTKMNDRKKKVYDVNKMVGSDDKAVTDWIDKLNDKELELADSDAFVRALEKQEEKLNGAALSAEDYETALQSLKDTQEDLRDATSFSKAFSDSAGLEIDNIIAQFNAGKITPETIASFEVFHDVMRKTGQTAEEVYEELEKFAEDFVSTDHMISDLEAMYTTMRDVKDEFKELGYISAGTLSAIAEKYPQLSSALTQYTSGLITEQDLIRQMEVLYQNDVEAYRVALTAKLQYDTTFFANVKKHNQEFFAELAKAYNLDVQNWRSLAQAKADIDTQLIQNLAKTWSKYYNIILDAETGLYTAQSNQDLTGLSAEESVAAIVRGTEVRSQVNSINEVIKKLDSISSLEVEVPNFKNPTSKSTKGGSSGSKGSSNKTEIDWIARRLERLQKIIDLTKSKFENLFSIKSKSSSLKKQITQTTDLLNAAIKAANKYKKYADSMKLFSDEKKNKAMKKLVQSGAYNISEYSSDMTDKINQYKEYYDNYKEQLKQVEDLKKEIRELQIEQYQLKADYQQSRVDKLEAQSSVTTSTQKKNELENKRIKALKKQYEYEIKIAEAQGDTIKAKQLELELEAEIVASKKAKFDIISTKYENRTNRKGYHLQDIENRVSLIEAKGSYVNGKYYNMQYDEQKALAKMYDEEEKNLKKRLDSIKKYSEEWYEALETIQDVQNKANDARIAMQEAADKMNDLAKSLDNLIVNKFSTMISEADTLMILLGDRLVDDDLGDFTNNGIAALGLIYAQMQAENEKGEQLRKQLAILEEQAASYQDGKTVTFIDANGMKRTISSLKELKDLEDETRNSIQESSKAEYTYYKNIIDLMKERYEAERDYLDDLISKKKELLDAEQDLHQYAKDIKEQADSIASLQKQLAALSGDNSLEGQARRQKIEAQLQESKDTLAETEYDRLISDQKDMLDNLSAEYAEMLESYMKNDDALYKEGLAVIKENSALINDVTTSVADKWGMELSGEMESVVGNINVVDSTLNGIRSDLQDYFASTQKESSDTSNQLTAGDLASIRDNIANIRDTGSGHNGTDAFESKELNKMDGMTSKPLNLISNNTAIKNNSGTGELVSMGSGKIATKFNNDQSIGKTKDDKEIIRVDNGNGEIMELVKKEVPPEWKAFARSAVHSPVNTIPNFEPVIRQAIENAPTNIENNTSNVNIENVSFSLPNVSNYRELMEEAKADPKFEGMIGYMIDTKLTGSNRLNKHRIKF